MSPAFSGNTKETITQGEAQRLEMSLMKERMWGKYKGTKDRTDERVVVGKEASFLCAQELMTGIRCWGDRWDLLALLDSSFALPSSQEICGNLTPFGLKSPDKTRTLWLN